MGCLIEFYESLTPFYTKMSFQNPQDSSRAFESIQSQVNIEKSNTISNNKTFLFFVNLKNLKIYIFKIYVCAHSVTLHCI
jgi:hypothetical protein